MEKTQKIIIIALIAVIIALAGAIGFSLMHEQTKTVELFKNGTTVEVPVSTNLTNQSEIGATYQTTKNTTIFSFDNSNLAGALSSKILSELLVDKGVKQDNGLYKLDKNSIMELGDQLGMEYNEKEIKEITVGIKHNNTVNQSVIIIGVDEKEISDILNSIHWKKGESTAVNATSTEAPSSSSSSADKTYPFYADDGSIVGYYHVGDVVEHYDGLYQLKDNGQWVYIGEAKGSSQDAYNQGYSDAVDDSSNNDEDYENYDDYEYEDPDTENSEQ